MSIIAPKSLDFTFDKFQVEFKDPHEINSFIYNNFTKTSLLVLMIGSVISAVSTNLGFGCFNVGATLIKFFQIIEILGKFLLLPVIFHKNLNDLLFSLFSLAELVNLDPYMVVKQKQEDLLEDNRYWNKLSQNSVKKNVL